MKAIGRHLDSALELFEERYSNYAVIALCALFIAAGILVSLNRYWQYEVSYIDFGKYDQALWSISRFKEPIIDHFVLGKINVFGDHVTPSVFLLSPLYWITDRSEVILIAQAVMVGLSGYLLYDLAKHVLKNKLLSLSILVSYFLFVGLQNAVITEFHELTIMALPLMATIWAYVKNKKILYFLFLLMTLGHKETTFALGIGIGAAIFFLRKDWRKISIATILLSFVWGLVSFNIILPYFLKGVYLYSPLFPEDLFGKAYALVDHPLKRETLFFSFLSFSFLPVFAWQFWTAIFQDYAMRFIPLYFETRWGLGLHYNAQSGVILAVSSVYGLRFILERLSLKKKYITILAILIIFNAIFLFRFVLHGPFLLALNKAFYEHTKNFKFLDPILAKVPKDKSVMTQSSLATRFTHQKVFLLDYQYENYNPEYILIDNRGGQNPNNFIGTEQKIESIIGKLKKDSDYVLTYHTDEQFIFKKSK
ncbi:MAG: hypothetical protein A2687_01510 [Candidatus Levybacteria bacterium RIFCSPHIGHO2_01_FULL_38_26]|nr:MAG: hypothetical protein A2687_01510 [Candidatus Levybacteria bacterium RIFCSPHIGHO2_01_FULL_38_26]